MSRRRPIVSRDRRALTGSPEAPDRGSSIRDPRSSAPLRGAPARHVSGRSVTAGTAHRALLPLRFFLGGMFVYAGIDKLVDPAFLASTGAGSVGAQLEAFTRISPLSPLVHALALPFPVLTGLLIAIAEIAIGLGALTGLLYRTSAACGAALSALFFLTASWTTRPIYYGPDLPYLLGWASLALAGHGDVLVLDTRLLERLRHAPIPDALRDDRAPESAGRRAILLGGVLAGATIVIAGGSRFLGRALAPVFPGSDVAAIATPSPVAGAPAQAPVPGAEAGTSPTPGAAAGAGASPSPDVGVIAASPSDAGVIGNEKQLKPRAAAAFTLPNGDPGVVVKLADGKIVAYDAVCTHEGCEVGYDRPSGLLFCPCHGATFDPAQGAAVLAGPAPIPLVSVPIRIDSKTGAITVTG